MDKRQIADESHSLGAAARPWVRAAYAGFFLWMLTSMAMLSMWRGLELKFDFSHFYLDAAYTWQHGALNPDLTNEDKHLQRQLPFYLPIVPLTLSPLAAFGLAPAAVAWAMIHVICFSYCLYVLYTAMRRRGTPGDGEAAARRDGGALLVAACILALPALHEATKFNQLSFITLALVLGGVRATQGAHAVRAGFLFACAALLKLLPGIMLVWLVMKRQWTAAAAMLGWCAVLALAPCLIAFGPQDTLRYHREWYEHNVNGAAAQGLVDDSLDDHFIDRRNQSIEVVLARWFAPSQRYHINLLPITLTEQQCTSIARGVKIALLGGLLLAVRRPATKISDRAFWCEASVFVLGMLVFSPLLRQYYLIWALPSVLLLVHFAAETTRGAQRTLGRVGVVLWILGMAAWAYQPLREGGAHLLMLIVLGIVLLRLAWLEQPVANENTEPARL